MEIYVLVMESHLPLVSWPLVLCPPREKERENRKEEEGTREKGEEERA